MKKLLLLLLFIPLISFGQNAFSKKTNFIIFFTDDQGYNDVGCFGSPDIKTPNLDNMAKGGMKFTNFYAQPLCGPSRAALLTGSYPIRIAEPKNTKDFHIIGKEILNVDIDKIITGKPLFGLDFKTEGMVYATVVRPPAFGQTLVSFDVSEAKSISGVLDVFTIGEKARNFLSKGYVSWTSILSESDKIVVVATSTWAALKAKKSRKEAIYAAYDRFYKGDIAKEIVRGTREQGGLFTEADLANWKVKIEEPLQANYRGIDVYKMQEWTQGPALLQSLNILENFDLKSMGYNSTTYIHTVYQAMSLAFADRDFYYGDPAFVQSPMKGLLSKEYAKERAKLIGSINNPTIGAGDPYPFQGGSNPYLHLLTKKSEAIASLTPAEVTESYIENFQRGTTTVEAADAEGWVLITTVPSDMVMP